MERRTFEGHMDWEPQSQLPMDESSPFAKLSQKSPTSSFDSPSKLRSVGSNPFAPNNTPMNSPFKVQGQPRPPHSEFFNPQLQNKPTGPAFRNPAFATPQKRVDDMFSPDSSPAMTDNSPMPAETPETEHVRDSTELFFTPSPIKSSPSKSLFARTLLRNHASGLRDKVRKRKRLLGDKDVGSARPRLPQDSDESDSYYEEENGSRSGSKHSKKKEPTPQGWLNSFLSAISANPTAPAILSKWLQLGVNMVLLGLVLFIIFWILVQVRNDLSHASEKARAAIVNEMAICSENYIKNGCSPKASRPPALDGPCNEWEACMNQDASAVMMVQISAKNVAEIVNEFVGVLSFKAWGFIMSLFLAAVIASNVGFGFLRESAIPQPTVQPAAPVQSPPAATVASVLGPAAMHNPQQAYIFAPIGQTPKSVRKALFANDVSDTENSPDFKSPMALPQTPSIRRSPSKFERGRSPSKGSRARSPVKGITWAS